MPTNIGHFINGAHTNGATSRTVTGRLGVRLLEFGRTRAFWLETVARRNLKLAGSASLSVLNRQVKWQHPSAYEFGACTAVHRGCAREGDHLCAGVIVKPAG
jgi:hypothetical protein